MNELSVEAPVGAVTLYEDRGELRREVGLEVPAGSMEIHLTGVTALVAEGHLSAWFSDGPARVEDIRVDRRWADPPASDRLRQLVEELREAREARAEAERLQHRTEERRTSAERLLAGFLARLGPTVWSGAEATPGWREGLERLEEAVDHARASDAEATRKLVGARASERRVAHLVDGEERHEARAEATIIVRASSESAGPARLVVTGVVPCALWRPTHEAHLLGDGTVRWTTFGTVWQRTGEALEGVELTLSTDRPGAGATLPELAEDRLSLREKAVKKRVVLEHREEAVSRDRGGAAVPGVYDGGEARRFSVEGAVGIPSDGRPHRVSTGRFETEAKTDLVAIPELATQVFLRARLLNRSAQPLLAGPVTLLRDGAYVGTGDVGYVGVGEPFELSFGSDDRFVVRHERRRVEEDRLLGKARVHFVTRAEIASGAATRERIEVALRMPVSELEALEVVPSEKHCSHGRPTPDADGLVRLKLDLAPGEESRVELGFHLERSGDIVLPDPW